MIKKRGYLLEWETQLRSKFKSTEKIPYRLEERDRLANVMTYEEILNTTEYDEDIEKRLKCKWKELLHFSQMILLPEHKHGVIENALWRFGNTTLQQFIMSLNYEFKFIDMDNHLKKLYYSLDGGTTSNIDWRDITASLQILTFFRLVRDKTVDLLEILFDIYAKPIEVTLKMKTEMSFDKINNENYIDDFKILLKIILLPCRLEHEIKLLSDLFEQCVYDYFKHSVFEKCPKITRGTFRIMLLSSHGEKLLRKWSSICWMLLPPSSRLTVLDEAQQCAQHNADIITSKYRLRIAISHHSAILIKKVFREWKIISAQGVFVRIHLRKKSYKKRNILFLFWLHFAQKCRLKRRRKILAEVMCNYTLKARCFNRIKLYNYSRVLINRTAGRFDKNKKFIFEGYARLRQFVRLYDLRKKFHQWWNQCVRDRNDEVATEHRFIKYTWPILIYWHNWAHQIAHNRRMEMVVLENQNQLEKMLKEADEDIAELLNCEKKRIERIENIEKEKIEIKRKDKFEKAKQFAKDEVIRDKNFTIRVQRDKRRRRVRKEMKKMKKDFNKKWNKKVFNIYIYII